MLCVTKCPFSVCSDDSLSLPTSFPGMGELSKLDPQTFSDPEILRRLTSSVSSALDEAASALNKHSEGTVHTVHTCYIWVRS